MPNGINIVDLRKVVNGSNIEQATSHIVPNVVPSVQQMIEKNKEEQRMKEKEAFHSMSKEEQDVEIQKNMPLAEMINGLKESLHDIYPDASVLILGTRPINKDTTSVCYEFCGSEEALHTAMVESMHHSAEAIRLINRSLIMFVKSCSSDEAEQGITALQDLIKDLRNRNSVQTQIALKRAEVKRCRKAGREDLARLKEKEIADLLDHEERRKKRHAQRLEALKLANAAKAEKKRKREQQERDRNRQQPNFAKMAKQKRQKIAARQAEKKKKSAGGEEKIKSCSMFANVG